MKKKRKNKKTWSRKFKQAKIGCWNPWSYSNERHEYCKNLNYDILGLTELHNNQVKQQFQGRKWICSAQAQESTDPAAGVAIMLSDRMADKVLDEGHVGTRIAWARIAGPICNIFFVVAYIPHKGRTTKPTATDTLEQLRKLLRTVRKSECIVLCGDFNCQLQRNVQGCTGQWCMTQRPNQNGHGDEVLELMRQNDLFAVCTLFKPKRKMWDGKKRRCNATYRPKEKGKRPTKLDYLCVSNRWKSMVLHTETRWGPSIHRFGQPFDHGFLSATWRWRTKKKKKSRARDYAAMSQSWPEFDTRLRLKLQQAEEPTRLEDNAQEQLASRYEHLTKSVRETIDELVPEKRWLKKNGRVVSEETKVLFEKRAKEYQKQKPTTERRKTWNKKIQTACRNDYRAWVARWVERIEQADNKGDTKAIYQGVKSLSGGSAFSTTKPTEKLQPAQKTDPKNVAARKPEERESARASANEVRASEPKSTARASQAEGQAEGHETVKNVRASGEKELKKAAASTRINGPEELARVWHDFLAEKFSPTKLEALRAEFEALPESNDDKQLTREEFEAAVKSMKNNKAPGADTIPSEVWKNSEVAKEELFQFLSAVWKKERVPPNLAVCVFIMIYKRKGSPNDCTKYRAIGLLNHAYKIMSTVLLRRIVEECKSFFSEWQAGFRAMRGCRDNVMLLRVLYDQVINNNSKCVVTYIDYTAAFDSVSHKFLDATLAKAGASAKSRAIFRAIYEAASGIARVRGIDGQAVYSEEFDVGRGVIQGDIMSPILFILALDQIIQQHDVEGRGMRCGRILRIKVLGYADDLAFIDTTVENMTARLTAVANASKQQADMVVNMDKTVSQHVHKREAIKATSAEAKAVENKYQHQCDFCSRRFKTRGNMLKHRAHCVYNYDTTSEVFEIERIEDVFGFQHSRWFLVKYKGYPTPEWSREHLLLRDGCRDSIRDFWSRTGKRPNQKYFPDPEGKHRCTICAKEYKRAQDLKAHRTRTKHYEEQRAKITATATVDAILHKRKAMQDQLPKVKWDEHEASNTWQFRYLGSIFEAGGGDMADVRRRIAMATQRFGKLRNVWKDGNLHVNLRMRLYKACVCSVLTYGSEAWTITATVAAAFNGANSKMVITITGKSVREEASAGKTFDVVMWIRARRLQ